MKHVTEHRDAEAQQRVIDEANTEYALAEALRRCLELAREGTRLESVAGSNGWHQVGRLQARLDAIVTVADLTLAAYGLEDKHAD